MQQKKLNPWSLIALFCAFGFCPLFTISAVFFGIRGLVDIKAKGDTRGVRLSWCAILIGSLITGLWGGGMLWWNINVRGRIEQGPITAIMDGQDGDHASFLAMLHPSESNQLPESFLVELQHRYGLLVSGEMNQDVSALALEGSELFLGMVPYEAELSYVLQFTNNTEVNVVAKFELFRNVDSSSRFTNRFAWFRVIDEIQGDLVYPANEVVEEPVDSGQ